MSLFQSNLRKQIRKLPKILQFVKIIHYYSELFTSLLNLQPFEDIDACGCVCRLKQSSPHLSAVPYDLEDETFTQINETSRKILTLNLGREIFRNSWVFNYRFTLCSVYLHHSSLSLQAKPASQLNLWSDVLADFVVDFWLSNFWLACWSSLIHARIRRLILFTIFVFFWKFVIKLAKTAWTMRTALSKEKCVVPQ